MRPFRLSRAPWRLVLALLLGGLCGPAGAHDGPVPVLVPMDPITPIVEGLSVAWSYDRDADYQGAGNDYVVQVRSATTADRAWHGVPRPRSPAQVLELVAGVAYHVRVCVEHDHPAVPADPGVEPPVPEVPAVPDHLHCSAISADVHTPSARALPALGDVTPVVLGLEVRWSLLDPAFDGGFKVEHRTDRALAWTASAETILAGVAVVHDLDPDRAYYVRVCTVEDRERCSVPTPDPIMPLDEASLLPRQVEVSAAPESLDVRWAPPSPPAAPGGYVVQHRRAGSVGWMALVAVGSPHRIRGLSSFSAYEVRVCGVAVADTLVVEDALDDCSEPSGPVIPLTGASVPGAPYAAPGQLSATVVAAGDGSGLELDIAWARAARDLPPGVVLGDIAPPCRAESAHAPAYQLDVLGDLDRRTVFLEGTARAYRGLTVVSGEDYTVEVRAVTLADCRDAAMARWVGPPASVDVAAPLGAPGAVVVASVRGGFSVGWVGVVGAAAYRVEFVPGVDQGADAFARPGLSLNHVFVAPPLDVVRIRLPGVLEGDPFTVRVVSFVDRERAGAPGVAPTSGVSRAVTVAVNRLPPPPPAFDAAVRDSTAAVSRELGDAIVQAVARRFGLVRPGAPARTAGVAGAIASLPASVRSLIGFDASPPARGAGLVVPAPVLAADDDSALAVWITGDVRSIAGSAPSVGLDGGVRSVHIGFESIAGGAGDPFTPASGYWATGLGLAFASGEVDYDGGSDADHGGTLTARSWLAYPYIGYRDDGRSAYALIGAGAGTTDVVDTLFQPDGGSQDHRQLIAGFGGSASLFGDPRTLEAVLRSSVSLTHTALEDGDVLPGFSVGAHRVRLGLDAAHVRPFASGLLSPTLGVGLRYDAGDGPTGAGLEAELGVAYTGERFAVDGHVGRLVRNGGDRDGQWWAGASARVDPAPGGRGLSFSFAPRWGVGALGDGDPLAPRALLRTALDREAGFEPQPDFSAHLGFGFPARGSPDSVLTPFLSGHGSGGRLDALSAGVRLEHPSRFDWTLSATQSSELGAPPVFAVQGRLAF